MAVPIFVAVRRSSGRVFCSISNMHLKADRFPSLVDTAPSHETKFEWRRWLRHKPDDANSIKTTAVIIGW